MTNARSIINQAARKIEVVGVGQTLSASEAQDMLELLNDMLETLSAEGGVINAVAIESFPLDGSTSYTIGSGGDFDTARPNIIEAAFVSYGGVDYPLSQISASSYANISDKDLGGIGEYYYYDNKQPLSTIYLHPIANSAYSLTLYSKKQLTSFADLTTDYTLDLGVKAMLSNMLAEDMAPEFGKEAKRTVVKAAKRAHKAVMVNSKRNNYPTVSVDTALIDNSYGYNIYSGDID